MMDSMPTQSSSNFVSDQRLESTLPVLSSSPSPTHRRASPATLSPLTPAQLSAGAAAAAGHLSVVPFHPPVVRSSLPHSGHLGSGSGGGGPPATTYELVGVCPTCHRPMGAPAGFSTSFSHTGEAFTPNYFRRLPLAIEQAAEQPEVRSTNSQMSSPDHNSPSSTPRTGRGGKGRRSRRQSIALESQPGMHFYVSPTTSAEMNSPTNHVPFVDNDTLDLLARFQQRQEEREMRSREEGEPSPPLSYYDTYFIESKKLGSGTFGGVYLCMHVMEQVPLGTFALKKIPVGDNAAYLQNVLREVRILEEVKRHPNVVEYNHSWVDVAKMADFGPPVRCLFILMEYANEGSLDSYLERNGTVLSTIAVWYFFLSAVAGTAHLHQKNVLHRDLKPQNLLLSTRSPGAPPRVLVSDFGTAAALGESADRTGGTGTLEYMAPELFEKGTSLGGGTGSEAYTHGHTKASDVWSLGLILHYLACGTALPRREDGVYGPGMGPVLLDVANLSPVTRPVEMVELIRAMLQWDPLKRPPLKEIMRSTVVQTLLQSFNTVVFSAQDLFAGVPIHSSPTAHEVVYDGGDEEEHLNSSRVELLSTLTMKEPLLQRYVMQGQPKPPAPNGGVGVGDQPHSPIEGKDSGRLVSLFRESFVSQQPHHLLHGGGKVDVGVQTDGEWYSGGGRG